MGLRTSRRQLVLVIAAIAVSFVVASPSAAQTPATSFRDCADCPEMVVVPAGSFTMGSPPTEANRRTNEGPQRQITFARPFAVGRFEVTRAQYAAFSTATGRQARTNCGTDRSTHGTWAMDPNGSWRDPAFSQGVDHPVVCVSWVDAQAYVAWLNSQTSGGYRLLSEAEWEYAARAQSGSAYPWGADANSGCAHMNGGDATTLTSYPSWNVVTCTDGGVYTTPVGSYRPNAFGLYDMIGNAQEWVADCHEVSLDSVPSDGRAYTGGSCVDHVLRGGRWSSQPFGLRAAYRHERGPNEATNSDGFRVAKTL